MVEFLQALNFWVARKLISARHLTKTRRPINVVTGFGKELELVEDMENEHEAADQRHHSPSSRRARAC